MSDENKFSLTEVGWFYDERRLRAPTYASERIDGALRHLREAFEQGPLQSVVLVGESGVGKTAIRRAFAAELIAAKWRVFETSAADIIAGQIYVGQIEGQVRAMLSCLEPEARTALFVDRLHELGTAGIHDQKHFSVIDQMLPVLERRELFMVGETTPQGYERLLRRYPGLPTVLELVKVEAAKDAEGLALAERLLEDTLPAEPARRRRELARESLFLARQYLTHRAAPGSVLELIGATNRQARMQSRATIAREDFLATISTLTGLPDDVLDDRQRLDLAALEARFGRAVMGQQEAVSCLVERIAMLKAGLTDAMRPVGVFLFAGPTGTGKTELAKTLAEILFGSPERMIRLDMSEFQSDDAVDRLLGARYGDDHQPSLATRVRAQPFSVILLDEFEKAYVEVWDLFLQVFDDGRLTGADGRVADFRHSIIILTSNLGATIETGEGIGFTSTSGEFSATDVTRSIARTFRKEFINRLDRVVVFRPLSRVVMRKILGKELDRVLERRGFRSREWAVEWEASALEFLLDKGFTPDLGARPLRRAIDRYLLAPLSFTIVRHAAPEGEQFLFVRSDGERIQVEFVDPDAEPDAAPAKPTREPRTLGTIVMDPRGSEAERELLRAHAEPLLERIGGEAWQEQKETLIATINESDFWERDGRHVVLDRVEQMDRIESSAAGARSLRGRLERSPTSRRLMAGLAEKLYLLATACGDLDQDRPTRAFLELRVRLKSGGAETEAFFQRLCGMYERWAKRRRMKLTSLETGALEDERIRLYAVAGFGAHTILAPERGLHVLATSEDKKPRNRTRVRVRVVPQPPRAAGSRKQWLALARQTLAELPESGEIVRHYQEKPSPLVRDKMSGWKTGRLDRVLEGDFDLFRLCD